MDSLQCPITCELFRDPVIGSDGHTYERESIILWLQQHGTSPITREPMAIESLRPNHSVRKMIEEFAMVSQKKDYQFRLNVDVRKAEIRAQFQAFGKSIYKAEWVQKQGPPIVLMKIEGAKASREASFYVKLSCHPHIVCTYGLVETDPNSVMLVQECAEHGDLRELLREDVFKPNRQVLIEIFTQIIDAMICLADNRIVHGDLACRNVLVFRFHASDPEKNLVKLTDFGLTKASDLFSVTASTSQTTMTIIPVRYAAPEVLRTGGERTSYSEKSDVYSMGVLMWEACSYATAPFSSVTDDDEVKRCKLRGDQLPKPTVCGNDLWSAITQCWKMEPSERPSFKQLRRQIIQLVQASYSTSGNETSTVESAGSAKDNRKYPVPSVEHKINESKDVQIKEVLDLSEKHPCSNEELGNVIDDEDISKSITNIICILDLDNNEKKDEIINDLLVNGRQSLNKYEEYLITDIYTEAMNGNDNELMNYLRNYFEQQWKKQYNHSNKWFVQFLNEYKLNENHDSYKQVLTRTAQYGNKFMKTCPILSITLQVLFEGIDDKCLKETNIFNELWSTITNDGLKSIKKYSDYIVEDIINEQMNKKNSILFQALREYYRQDLFQLLQQSNITDRQNLYDLALDYVAEDGWKIGVQAIQKKTIPKNFKILIEKLDSFLQKQKDLQEHLIHPKNTDTIDDHSEEILATVEILNQMRNVMTQMYELKEFTTPRYFFILPVKNHEWAPMNTMQKFFKIHYKLYFLCECSNDPQKLHIAPHDGYFIKNPREFITKYALYLRTMQSAVRVLHNVAGFVIPQLGNVSTGVDNNNPVSTKSCINSDGMKQKLKFVENLFAKTNNMSKDATFIVQEANSRDVPLQNTELRELQSYLELVNNEQNLGNLYRTITIDGNVRWVCLEHYHAISLSEKLSEYSSQLATMGGRVDQEKKEVIIADVTLSSKKVKKLCEIIKKGFNVAKMVLQNCWIWEDDFDILLDFIMNCSSIPCLKLASLDVRNWIGLSKYICEYAIIHFNNQSFKVRFSDGYRDGNKEILVRLLLQNKSYRTLDFSACDFLGHESELVSCFDKNEILTKLIIRYSNNNDILKVISSKMKNLQQLNLDCSLGLPATSSYFCEMLKANQTLVEIDIIDSIHFNDEIFITELLTTVRKHKSIKHLNLQVCDIKPSNNKETCLVDSLINDTFISRLCLSESIISHKLTEALVHASQEHRSLTHLEFYVSQISADDVKQLQSLHNHETLIHLIISEQPRYILALDGTNDSFKKGPIISSPNININTKWKQHGITIAGGNGKGNQVNQLSSPYGIYVDDDDQCIYIANYGNARIVQWKYNAKNGQVVAGGNEEGNQINQLNQPIDVIVDRKNDSLIISDLANRRIVRWPRQNGTNGQIIISDIDCYGLAMDNNGNLYVSDSVKNEVRRYKTGETNGIIVAGGNGKGDKLNQLNEPAYLFVDQDYSVYVSDYGNHRVVKWLKGAKEGIVVAGGQGKGNSLTQLSDLRGVMIDHLGNVYVADMGNHRIICWPKKSKEGRIIVGGNGFGEQSNQFKYLRALSFDREGNIYVVDCGNNRIQKFEIDSN